MPDPMPAIRTPWGSLTPTDGVAAGGGEPAPAMVPDHTLLRRIGRGSYGEVWLATNALGLYRAVKVLHRSAFTDDRPFEREFAGIQRFEPVSRSHESQLNILHVGRIPDHFYYVMELADDQGHGPVIDESSYTPRTLRSELLFRGRLPVDECLRLGLALSTALGHLHRHGLVHRDIKPSNIVFVNGIPKLADIGLVAQAERTMSFVGTEGYLPPEGPGTVQADLFSLGKVLYEISTGHDRQQFPELPTHLTELPDRAALAEFNEVLVRACAPDVKQRYQTAAEMHADLALLQSGGSVARQRRLAGQLRFVQRAGALITGLAAVIALGWWWQARKTEQARLLAVENSRLAEENRGQVARLDVANGLRQLDAGDPGGALLWFAEALPLVTNRPDVESVHRIRIGRTLRELPRMHQLLVLDGEASAVAFSPDARLLAAGTASGRVHLWEAGSGKPVHPPLESGLEAVRELRFLDNGRRIFVAATTGTGPDGSGGLAAVLDVAAGRPVVALKATNLVRAALSPDERWLVTADRAGTLRRHDAQTGTEEQRFTGHTTHPLQIEVSADGRRLAASAEDFPARFQRVRVWRMPEGDPVGVPIRCARGTIALSADGRFLAVASSAADGGSDTIVEVWDLESGSGSPAITRHPGTFKRMQNAARDGYGFLLLTDQQCSVLDPVTGRKKGQPFVPPAEATTVAVSPDGRWIAFGAQSGFAGSWNLEQGWPELPPLPQEVPVAAVQFRPDGRQIAVAGIHGVIQLLGAQHPHEDGMLRFDAPLGTGAQDRPVPRLLNRTSQEMLVILDDGSVRQVDLENLKQQRLPSGLPERDRAMQAMFDRTGQHHVLNYGKSATLWAGKGEGESPTVVSVSGVTLRGAGFTGDGQFLAAACSDGQVRLWRTEDGGLHHSFPIPVDARVFLSAEAGRVLWKAPGDAHFQTAALPGAQAVPVPGLPAAVTEIRFSPNGRRFAALGPRNTVRVWRSDTLEPVSPLLDHGAPVLEADWSPDGRFLVTAGASAEVRVWDADAGELRHHPLAVGEGPVRVVAWSPDGRLLAAGDAGGTARVWDAATGEPVTAALGHRLRLRAVRFATEQRLLTLSDMELLRTWDLLPNPLPAGDLAGLARLFSGRRVTSGGALQKVAATEMTTLFGRLRERHPGFFSESRGEQMEWHRRQVGLTLDLSALDTALVHLDRLAELAPEDPEVNRTRASYRARQVPPRSADTPVNLLDLSRFYSGSLDTTMYGEFAGLPRGVQRLAGTLWDLRGAFSVRSGLAMKDLPVGQRCRQLHFLHYVGGYGAKDGQEVAHWLIRYADGSTVEWPLIYGEQLRDWWWNYGHPREARQAVIAWEGQPDILAHGVRLFKATWTNPKPDLPIQSLDLVGDESPVSTSVVAITAE